MTSGPEVLCIGESMALFVPAEAGPPEEVKRWLRTIGGAESNVACNLAAARRVERLGERGGRRPVRPGDAAPYRSRDVDVSACYVDPLRPTGLYVKESGAGGSPVRYYRTGSAASGMGPALLDRLTSTASACCTSPASRPRCPDELPRAGTRARWTCRAATG